MENFYTLLAILLGHKLSEQKELEYFNTACGRLGVGGTDDEKAAACIEYLHGIFAELVKEPMRQAKVASLEEAVETEYEEKYLSKAK